jgi:hypothetical protein
VQLLVRWAFLGLWLVVLKFELIPLQLRGEHIEFAVTMMQVTVALVALMQLLPGDRVPIASNALIAALTLFFGAQVLMVATDEERPAAAFVLDSPFRGELLVVQGGNSPLVNIHSLIQAQRDALDVVALRAGELLDGDRYRLTAHACFGQTIYAPIAGRVMEVVNDRPDMRIHEMDHDQPVGNHVVIEAAPERYVLLAHLKQGSVTVKVDDQVACGQPIAQCGNSGNTSEPHLHIQVQDRPDFDSPKLKTIPIVFRNAVRVRNQQTERGGPFYLRRNDHLLSTDAACQN